MKAVYLDRDGVINVDKGYIYKIEDFEFIPGAIKALKSLSDAGYKLVIITNQSGIGMGYYSEDDLMKLHAWLEKELARNGLGVKIYHCPHHPKSTVEMYRVECNCRKPRTGMIDLAVKQLSIDNRKSYMIGDKTTDIKCGVDAGCKTILVRTGFAGSDRLYNINPNIVAKDLLDAADFIMKNG